MQFDVFIVIGIGWLLSATSPQYIGVEQFGRIQPLMASRND